VKEKKRKQKNKEVITFEEVHKSKPVMYYVSYVLDVFKISPSFRNLEAVLNIRKPHKYVFLTNN
jgi:hypothetical protein